MGYVNCRKCGKARKIGAVSTPDGERIEECPACGDGAYDTQPDPVHVIERALEDVPAALTWAHAARVALDALVAAGWHVIRITPDENGQAHYNGQRCRLGDEWTPASAETRACGAITADNYYCTLSEGHNGDHAAWSRGR